MSLTQYNLRPADPNLDKAAVLSLWRQSFTRTAQHPIKFEWCYTRGTQQQGRLYLLEDKGKAQIIGVQGVVTRRWCLQGQVVDAGVCADLVVDRQYRAIGPALTLVTGAVAEERHRWNLKILYAFPNPRTEALYRRKAYSQLPDISRYAKLLRSRVWLQRKGLPHFLASMAGALIDLVAYLRHELRADQGVRLKPVSEFDTRFDELWERVSQRVTAMAIRDAAFLQWRFGNHFVGETQILVMDAGPSQIDGYIVYTVSENRIVTILDFLASDDERVFPVMLHQFITLMRQRDADGITVEFCGSSSVVRCLQQLGFSMRERRPVYLLLGQQALNQVSADRLFLTSSDRDQ